MTRLQGGQGPTLGALLGVSVTINLIINHSKTLMFGSHHLLWTKSLNPQSESQKTSPIHPTITFVTVKTSLFKEEARKETEKKPFCKIATQMEVAQIPTLSKCCREK